MNPNPYLQSWLEQCIQRGWSLTSCVWSGSRAEPWDRARKSANPWHLASHGVYSAKDRSWQIRPSRSCPDLFVWGKKNHSHLRKKIPKVNNNHYLPSQIRNKKKKVYPVVISSAFPSKYQCLFNRPSAPGQKQTDQSPGCSIVPIILKSVDGIYLRLKVITRGTGAADVAWHCGYINSCEWQRGGRGNYAGALQAASPPPSIPATLCFTSHLLVTATMSHHRPQ